MATSDSIVKAATANVLAASRTTVNATRYHSVCADWRLDLVMGNSANCGIYHGNGKNIAVCHVGG